MKTLDNEDFNVAVTTLINHMKTIYQCSTVFGHNQSDRSPESSSINDLRFAQEPFKIYPVFSTLRDFGLRTPNCPGILSVKLITKLRRQLLKKLESG